MKYKVSNFSSKKAFMNLDVYSFVTEESSTATTEQLLQGPVEIVIDAKIKNFNTIEAFNNFDFHAFFCNNNPAPPRPAPLRPRPAALQLTSLSLIAQSHL